MNKESQPASRAPLPLYWLGEALAGCVWWAAVTALVASSCCSWNMGDRSAASILTTTGDWQTLYSLLGLQTIDFRRCLMLWLFKDFSSMQNESLARKNLYFYLTLRCLSFIKQYRKPENIWRIASHTAPTPSNRLANHLYNAVARQLQHYVDLKIQQNAQTMAQKPWDTSS